MKIEVDDEVYARLKQLAEPFVDTPNTVLRRVLFDDGHSIASGENTQSMTNSRRSTRSRWQSDKRSAFVHRVLDQEFGNGFQRKMPYRWMFENDDKLVYFQNYEKPGSAKLWFRIHSKPWSELCAPQKHATICFTNPADRICYLIPVADIQQQVEKTGWERDYLEVNIDHAESRWVDLNWKIGEYLKNLDT